MGRYLFAKFFPAVCRIGDLAVHKLAMNVIMQFINVPLERFFFEFFYVREIIYFLI